jgi:general stress protein 26
VIQILKRIFLFEDKLLIDKFWNIFVSAWFPKGKEDSSVALIEVKTNSAEFWDADANKIVQVFDYAKALLSNEKPDMGEHKNIQF